MTPASTQILDIIDTRLKRIKTSNGFTQTVPAKNIQRSEVVPSMQIPGINYYSLDDIIAKDFGVENHSLNISIEYKDQTIKVPFNDIAALRATDILKAINEDSNGNESPYLGDLIDSIEILAVTPIINPKKIPLCGVAVDLLAKFKTPIFDHSTIL